MPHRKATIGNRCDRSRAFEASRTRWRAAAASTLARGYGGARVIGAAVLTVGCVESVPLGGECPGGLKSCPDQFTSPDDPARGPEAGLGDTSSLADAALDAWRGGLEAGNALDGEAPPVAQLDAARAVDADVADAPEDTALGVDAWPSETSASFPALQNGSFTLTGGNPGELALAPIDPLAIGTNLADPWAACRTGFNVVEHADVVQGSGAAEVLPSDGATFVESNLGPIDLIDLAGLRQTLQTPLRSAERYALRIDVRAAQGAHVTIELWSSFVDCLPAVKLADVGDIADSGWQSVCVSFVAPSDVPELILLPRERADSADPRVVFDTIRPGLDCQ